MLAAFIFRSEVKLYKCTCMCRATPPPPRWRLQSTVYQVKFKENPCISLDIGQPFPPPFHPCTLEQNHYQYVLSTPDSESAERFIEDQAFSLSYDLDPHPPPTHSLFSKFSLFLNLPVSHWSSLLRGE
jgi:hypothetical protein